MLDSYDIGFLECYSLDLDAFGTDLTLIDQCRGMVKTSEPTGTKFISIYDRRWQALIPYLRNQIELLFSLSHKLFGDRITTLLEEKISFPVEIDTPTQGSAAPSLRIAIS